MLHDSDLNHEYLPIAGHAPFLSCARDLILGDESGASDNVISLQTISGTGANHLGAAFLAEHLKPKKVFFSDPTWSNHHLVWQVAAPNVTQKQYPYYHTATRGLDFDGMLAVLQEEAVENDVVILHACAHNPTGIDPSREQWQQLAQLFTKKKLFAFFDSAYQGFATGDVEADAWAVRHFHQVLFPNSGSDSSSGPAGMCVAQSFAKNFGLYGERAGAFHLILPPATARAGAQSELVKLTRAEISNPPLFGARIVYTILSDATLRTMWLADLRTMSTRIRDMRQRLREAIEKCQQEAYNNNDNDKWAHLTSQIGMFSYTGLDVEQVSSLREKQSVYLMRNGRASMSGLNEKNVLYVARAIFDVCRQQ